MFIKQKRRLFRSYLTPLGWAFLTSMCSFEALATAFAFAWAPVYPWVLIPYGVVSGVIYHVIYETLKAGLTWR